MDPINIDVESPSINFNEQSERELLNQFEEMNRYEELV